MRKSVVLILVGISFAAGAVIGVLGLLYSTGNLEPSKDTIDAAPTLSLDGPTPTPGELQIISTQYAGINNRLDGLSTQVAQNSVDLDAALSSAALAVVATDVAATEVAPTPTPTAIVQDEESSTGIAQRALYRITEQESAARFYIDETLSGSPITVIGITSRVAGDIIVNFADPAASQLGTIAVNVRTLHTDNEYRDDSIKSLILSADREENEFVTFSPTELIGLPTTPVNIGDVVSFQIAGDLTIKGATHNRTFDAAVTIVSAERIEGIARTEILYEDFNITIRPPPAVSGIGDVVTLEIDLVALLVED
jgi:polyisoprenoid-binding protein YceI